MAYMIMNQHGVLLHNKGVFIKDQVLNAAKARADSLKNKNNGENYTVIEFNEVYHTDDPKQ